MSLPASVTITPGLVFQAIADSALLLDPAQGAYFGLEGVGLRIWELLQQGQQPAAILAQLLDEYDAPLDVLTHDLQSFLMDMRQAGLVTF
jgi:hypothetical protein